MPDTLREGQPAAAGRAFTHQALIYATDDHFLGATVAFVLAGLAAAEPVFIATTARNTSLLRGALGTVQAARVEFAPVHRQYHSPAQTLLNHRDRAQAGTGHIRVLSETFGSRRAREQAEEWTRYEALLNLALATSRAWILCPYDTRHLPANLLHGAHLTHPYLVNGHSDTNGEGTMANPGYADPHHVSASCDTHPWTRRPAYAADFPFRRANQLTALREFAAHHAHTIGLDPERVNALLVSVTEAATNTLKHGAGRGTCRIWETATELLCDITDPTGTLDPALAGYLPPVTNLPEGRGLWIIRQLCDTVDIRTTNTGSTIRLHFTLRTAQPTEPPAPPDQAHRSVSARPSGSAGSNGSS
jgi:anti-sigma regulatory factor (Ser/Thr protein kinase)